MAQLADSGGSVYVRDENDFPRLVVGPNGVVTVRDSIGENATVLANGGGVGSLPIVDSRDFVSAGDTIMSRTSSMTSGSKTLTVTSDGQPTHFLSTDVGKRVTVLGAGTGGAPLATTIASYNSALSVELTAAAVTTVSNAWSWWGTVVTTQLQNWLTACVGSGQNETKLGFLAQGNYLIDAPLLLSSGVSIIGAGWNTDPRFYYPSAFFADGSFTGSTMLQQSHVGIDSALAWHGAVLERVAFFGLGATGGVNGFNVGTAGEASTVRNVIVVNCQNGLYATSDMASLTVDTLSVNQCGVGVNLDGINSTATFTGLMGNNNTSILRVKGGNSVNVTVVGFRSEDYNAGTANPPVLIEDLDGGQVAIYGGWLDTTSAKNTVVQINRTTATNRAKVILAGVAANGGYYTNMVQDVDALLSVPIEPDTISHPFITYNTKIVNAGPQGGRIWGYGEVDVATQSNGVVRAMITMATDNKLKIQNPVNSGVSSGIIFRDYTPADVASVDLNGDKSFGIATHLRGTGSSAPSIAAEAGAGTSPTISVTGTDFRGGVSVAVGTTPAAGALCTVTFAAAYAASVGFVSLTPTSTDAVNAGLYVSAKSTTVFTVSCKNTPAGTLTFDFAVIG